MNEFVFDRLSQNINQHQSLLSPSRSYSIVEIPFELVTQDDWRRSTDTEDVLELMTVWVIDCLDNRWISKVFNFLKNLESILLSLDGMIPRGDSMGNDSVGTTDHLKTLRPLPGIGPSTRSTILLAATSKVTFRELTKAMLAHEPILGLIQQSTPYRIKAPRRPSRLHAQSIQWSRQYWPLDLNRLSNLTAKLNGPNQPMIIKQWSFSEITWVLHRLAHVLSLAHASGRDGELGVAAAVSVNYLNEPPSESDSSPPVLLNEPDVLAKGLDMRTSTRNPLCHAFIELINNVARLDQLKLRHPIDEKGQIDKTEIPYLLTNLIVFATHEPCLCCSMALLHSRIKHLFYLVPAPGSGGCGSIFNVHEQDGLNHKFFVWKLKSDQVAGTTGFDP